MTEQKKRFMEELDQWSDDLVIQPIWGAARKFYKEDDGSDEGERVFADAKKAVRDKVFESYGAGCRATEEKLGVKKPKREKEG